LKNRLSQNNKPEKQHTAEFEQCIQNVMKQGHEKGSAFAICTATFEKAQKPIFLGESEAQKLHLFSESVKLEDHKVSGVAIHPKRIFHPEENMTHVYLREELQNAAPTLIGKPFGIDHMYVLPPPNLITKAWYDPKEDGVAFEGTVDDQIAEQIQDKAFKGISIELNWLRPGGKVEFQNGVAPRNFELTSVHLLRKFPPGDRDAYIKFWNAIMEQMPAGPAQTLDQKVDMLLQRFESFTSLVNERFAKIEGTIAGLAARPGLAESTEPGQLKEAEWDTAYINDLPDSAFAVISSGGQKDEHGKTTPRTLRHLPHHKADGSLDLAHLRNALARLPQTELSAEDKAEAKKHLCAHAKDSEIVSEVCGEQQPKEGESEEVKALDAKVAETEGKLNDALKRLEEAQQNPKPQQEPVDIVNLRKELVETQSKLADADKRTKAEKDRFNHFHEAVKDALPNRETELRWLGTGPKLFAERVKRVLHEFQPS
jgi:hypothetical protein